MEKQRQCKVCSKTFANGRALGGHMKAHLATFPLPPKTTTDHNLLAGAVAGNRTESGSASISSYSYSSGEEEEEEEVIVKASGEEAAFSVACYGLRENPKKSYRLADPVFSFAVDAAGSSVVQDRESETESRNPTRRRSKRARKSVPSENRPVMKQNFDAVRSKNPTWVEMPPAEQEPVSSVSDTSPEEDIAMCLMMLSRDTWVRNNGEEGYQEQGQEDGERSVEIVEETEEIKGRKVRRAGKLQCEKCMKVFRSSPALRAHRSICSLNETELRNAGTDRIFECPYCFKLFGSGQALGGHKRTHLVGSSGETPVATNTAIVENSVKKESNLIDLNLPAPIEDDDFSVVSDA